MPLEWEVSPPAVDFDDVAVTSDGFRGRFVEDSLHVGGIEQTVSQLLLSFCVGQAFLKADRVIFLGLTLKHFVCRFDARLGDEPVEAICPDEKCQDCKQHYQPDRTGFRACWGPGVPAMRIAHDQSPLKENRG